MPEQPKSDAISVSDEAREARKRTVIMRLDPPYVADMTGRDREDDLPGVRFRCRRCGHLSGRIFGLTPSAIARGLPCRICNA